MHFFEVKLKKQRAILLEIMPELNAVLDVVEWLEKTRSGGEKAKAAKTARLAAIKAEAAAISGDNEAKAQAEILKVEALEAVDAAETEALESGFKIIRESIDILLNKQYNGIVKIIATLYGTTPEKLEEEKSLFDLTDMVYETLANEKLMSFFPQLRRLNLRMESGTSPK